MGTGITFSSRKLHVTRQKIDRDDVPLGSAKHGQRCSIHGEVMGAWNFWKPTMRGLGFVEDTSDLIWQILETSESPV